MNYPDIAVLINILGAAVVSRIWGWVGVTAYTLTYIIMAMVFK
jgi:hypothetical protein